MLQRGGICRSYGLALRSLLLNKRRENGADLATRVSSGARPQRDAQAGSSLPSARPVLRTPQRPRRRGSLAPLAGQVSKPSSPDRNREVVLPHRLRRPPVMAAGKRVSPDWACQPSLCLIVGRYRLNVRSTVRRAAGFWTPTTPPTSSPAAGREIRDLACHPRRGLEPDGLRADREVLVRREGPGDDARVSQVAGEPRSDRRYGAREAGALPGRSRRMEPVFGIYLFHSG